MTSGVRDRLGKLRKSEQLRKQRKERGVKRTQFIKDPYGFTRDLSGETRLGTLTSSKEEIEEFLRAAHGDTQGPRSGQPPNDQQCRIPLKRAGHQRTILKGC